MLRLQLYTFKRQTISSVVILGSALLAAFYQINYEPGYNYGAQVILDNADFNILITIIAATGALSFLLSFQPNWTNFLEERNWKR